LAYLIRGDLLTARARPLTTFGNLPDAPADKQADLREEAIARLKAYRNRPPSNYVPRYLLQMEQDQKYAVVVDAQRSRSTSTRTITSPALRRRLLHHPRQTRRREVPRRRQAHPDRCTTSPPICPARSYRILRQRCFSDQLSERMGPPTRPRRSWNLAPRHSERHLFAPAAGLDGCVVLTNRDLDAPSPTTCRSGSPGHHQQYHRMAQPRRLGRRAQSAQPRNRRLAQGLGNRDVKRYLAHYSKNFRNNEGGYDRWAEQKRLVTAGKSWIKVELAS
jgi:hypothetical protein